MLTIALATYGCAAEVVECTDDWLGTVCTSGEEVVRLTNSAIEATPFAAVDWDAPIWTANGNALTGELFASIGTATVSCTTDRDDPVFAVVERRPPSILVLSARTGAARASYGGQGEAPGEFERVEALWPSGGCRLGAYDQRQHRVTWIDIDDGVDSVRSLVAPEGLLILHRIAGRLREGRLVGYGVRYPTPPAPEVAGSTDIWYRMGAYAPGGEAFDTIIETPGTVEFQVTPYLLGQSPFRPETQMWADSSGIWFANGHWPFIRQIGADGMPGRTIWMQLDRRRVTEQDRETFRDWHARSASDDPAIIESRRSFAEHFEFPEFAPYYYEALAFHETIWLRTSGEHDGRGGTWLVVARAEPRPLVFVDLPERARPLAQWSNVLLIVQPTSLGEPVLKAYELTTS